MAGPLLVHDGALIRGDKFLYSLEEPKDPFYHVAIEQVNMPPEEIIAPVWVTAARTARIERLQDHPNPLLGIVVIGGVGGQSRWIWGLSLTGLLWEYELDAENVGVNAQLDSKRNVLLTESFPAGFSGPTYPANQRYTYIDGATGNVVFSFNRRGGVPSFANRESVLDGWNYALLHNGETIDGWTYYVSQNWEIPVLEGRDYWSGQVPHDIEYYLPPGGFPESSKAPKMWAKLLNTWLFGDGSRVRMTSSGFILLRAEAFTWYRIRETGLLLPPYTSYGPDEVEMEAHLGAVQYAIAWQGDGTPTITKTFDRSVTITQKMEKSSIYSEDVIVTWQFGTPVNSGTQIFDPAADANGNELRAEPALHQYWVYGTTPTLQLYRYHKLANDGRVLNSWAGVPSQAEPFSHAMFFTERSRYFLFQNYDDPNDFLGKRIFRVTFGAESTPPKDHTSDEIQNCLVVESGEFLQVEPFVSDVQTYVLYNHIWRFNGINPLASTKVARVAANAGAPIWWPQANNAIDGPVQPERFVGRYMGNGFSLGKQGDYGGTHWFCRLDDFGAGSSVAYLIWPKSVEKDGVEYALGYIIGRRDAWFDESYEL